MSDIQTFRCTMWETPGLRLWEKFSGKQKKLCHSNDSGIKPERPHYREALTLHCLGT